MLKQCLIRSFKSFTEINGRDVLYLWSNSIKKSLKDPKKSLKGLETMLTIVSY